MRHNFCSSGHDDRLRPNSLSDSGSIRKRRLRPNGGLASLCETTSSGPEIALKSVAFFHYFHSLRLPNQAGQIDSQGFGYFEQAIKRGFEQSTFDVTDSGATQPRPFSECFLRKPLSPPLVSEQRNQSGYGCRMEIRRHMSKGKCLSFMRIRPYMAWVLRSRRLKTPA